jgi:hypothetical protein
MARRGYLQDVVSRLNAVMPSAGTVRYDQSRLA